MQEYYTKLESILTFIFHTINQPSFDPDVRTSVLLDLAIAGGHCGTRYKTETSAWHRLLSRGVDYLSLQQEVEKILLNARLGVIEKMSKKATYPDGRKIEEGNRPHTYNQILRSIGAEFGIPGVDGTYVDTAFWIKRWTVPSLKRIFAVSYTTKNATDRIDTAINGVFDASGKRIAGSQDIHPALVDSWFKERMPKDWKRKEPLLFTTIQDGESERTVDFDTFIVTVREKFEAEKKRFAEMSDEEIVKCVNFKIREYLHSQYRIKVGDDVDVQDWVQVERCIQAQVKDLKGGYRGLLEQPGKLGEIKEYIDKLKGRKNYEHYIVKALLSEFGVIAPYQWESWEAIQQVIENMRCQEYVDTVIRKDGKVPREIIIAMLMEMGVFEKV